jgi:hypothetical protein
VGNVTSGTQDNKTTPVNWRGIENLWGNISSWVDGINVYGRQIYICNSYTFVDNTADGYIGISFSAPASTGYITRLGYDSNNPWALLAIGSSSTGTELIGDYFTANSFSSYRAVAIGGDYTLDSEAGMFYWYSTGSGNSSTLVGARLMYIPSAV